MTSRDLMAVGAALVLAVALVLARTAAAGTSTGASTTAVAGQQLRFSGDGCSAGSIVELTLGGAALTTATAAADGTWRADVVLTPDVTPGSHTIEATCGDLTRTIDLRVLPTADAATDRGAVDEGRPSRLLAVGAMVMVLALAALIVTRGRRLAAATAGSTRSRDVAEPDLDGGHRQVSRTRTTSK